MDLEEFMKLVAPEPMSGCWLWLGTLNRGRYGVMAVNGKTWRAHRFAYETFKAPIGAGLTIDHLCRVTSCMNPDHMQPVTSEENSKRRWDVQGRITTHCKKGHELTPENSILIGSGQSKGKKWKMCRRCLNSKHRDYYHRTGGKGMRRAAFD